MKISKNTKPYKAGIESGKALVKSVQLFYLDKNILNYLWAIREVISDEILKRLKNNGRHHTEKTRPSKKTSTNKGMETPSEKNNWIEGFKGEDLLTK